MAELALVGAYAAWEEFCKSVGVIAVHQITVYLGVGDGWTLHDLNRWPAVKRLAGNIVSQKLQAGGATTIDALTELLLGASPVSLLREVTSKLKNEVVSSPSFFSQLQSSSMKVGTRSTSPRGSAPFVSARTMPSPSKRSFSP